MSRVLDFTGAYKPRKGERVTAANAGLLRDPRILDEFDRVVVGKDDATMIRERFGIQLQTTSREKKGKGEADGV